MTKNEEYRRMERLIDKYSTKQPAERWGIDAEWKAQRLKYMKKKMELFEGLNSGYFKLVGSQIDRAKYLIKKLDFKCICGKCSNEQIITMIAVYVKIEYYEYPISRYQHLLGEFNINRDMFINFLIKLNKFHMDDN